MKVGTRRDDVGSSWVEVRLAAALTSAPKRYHQQEDEDEDDHDPVMVGAQKMKKKRNLKGCLELCFSK